MKLQYFNVEVYDKNNKLIYAAHRTGFDKQEAIRRVAEHFEDQSGSGTGYDYFKYEYPLTFKSSIKKD